MATAHARTYNGISGGTIAGGRYRYPAWRRALTSRVWAQIGSNKLSDINPTNDAAINPTYPTSPWGNQANMIASWNGGGFDSASQEYVVWGGGHSDYAGNEVYGIDLSLDAPAWSLLIKPSGAIGNTGTLDYGANVADTYFDGRPRSQHTYGNLVCVGAF